MSAAQMQTRLNEIIIFSKLKALYRAKATGAEFQQTGCAQHAINSRGSCRRRGVGIHMGNKAHHATRGRLPPLRRRFDRAREIQIDQ